MSPPDFSIIMCSIDAGKFARISESWRHLFRQHSHEIIGIHDATSLAEGYNRGIAQSSGGTLIFSHDDILILDDDFPNKIAARLRQFDLLGFAGTDKLITAPWFGAGQPHLHGVTGHARPGQPDCDLTIYGAATWPVVAGIHALDGLCMIARRELAETIRFDAGNFDGFHLYDLDFSFRSYLAGYQLGVCCDIPVLHESTGNYAGGNHTLYAERFLLKYADPLGKYAGEEFDVQRPGRTASFRDHHTLLRAWQPEIITRTTLALRRDCPKGT